jgi:thioredoxin 1
MTMDEAELAKFDEGNFDEAVLSAEGLVIVDFWGEGCIPCKQLGKVLSQLATEIPPDVRIGTVNTNENPNLALRYGIRGVPALLFFKRGAVVDMRTGVDRRQVLKKLIEAHA